MLSVLRMSYLCTYTVELLYIDPYGYWHCQVFDYNSSWSHTPLTVCNKQENPWTWWVCSVAVALFKGISWRRCIFTVVIREKIDLYQAKSIYRDVYLFGFLRCSKEYFTYTPVACLRVGQNRAEPRWKPRPPTYCWRPSIPLESIF